MCAIINRYLSRLERAYNTMYYLRGGSIGQSRLGIGPVNPVVLSSRVVGRHHVAPREDQTWASHGIVKGVLWGRMGAYRMLGSPLTYHPLTKTNPHNLMRI